MRIGDKIIPYDRIVELQTIKKNKVMVGGCFDILHYGHLTFLKQAKNNDQVLIVVLEPDEFITKIKKRKPVHSQLQRAEILANLIIVDYVVLLPLMNTYEEYLAMVKTIRPQIVAVTKGDQQYINKKKQIELIGGEIKVVTSYIPGFSTHEFIKSFSGKFI